MPGITDVRHLGDYIREQRSSSQISLRQLAKLAGVSNPYLSQIERGLRKPSAEILQARCCRFCTSTASKSPTQRCWHASAAKN